MLSVDAEGPTAEELAALLAHDLRTPLNAVRGFAELLLGGAAGALSAAQFDLVGEIARAARSLEAAVELAQELAEPPAGEFWQLAVDLEPLLRAEGFVPLGTGLAVTQLAVASGAPETWRPLFRACRLYLLGGVALTTPPIAALSLRGPGCLELVMERPDMSTCWQMSVLGERLLRRRAAMAQVRIVSSSPHVPLVLQCRIARASGEG